MRMIIAFALSLALALAFTVSLGGEVEAKGKNKMCKAANMVTGAKASWKCKAAEKCCYDQITAKGTCVPASGMCL